MRSVNVGVLGCGTVGRGFLSLLSEQRTAIAKRHGIDLRLSAVAIRDRSKHGDLDDSLLTTDVHDVLTGEADIIVELIGGTVDARSYVVRALAGRKHVVTANKALLAATGRDLFDLASIHRVQLGYEASVCGAIPIVRVLRGALSSSRVRGLAGVINGTCNYVLSAMERGVEPTTALSEAQALGLAEADTSLDVSGEDAAQKLAILSFLAFGPDVAIDFGPKEGIEQVTLDDVARATASGEVIRLVARAVRRGADRVELSVRPEHLHRDHPLARLQGEANGIVIDAEGCGELSFFGSGAGGRPAASAVLADVVEIATLH
jgi:homoserine dehydrogenase